MKVTPGRAVGYDPASDEPPRRPASLRDLPFRRMPAVRWYAPSVIAKAGLRAVMSSAFGSYLDKRELQTVLPAEPFTDLDDRGEVWMDYVADTGDGFDETYTVAGLVGRAALDVDGVEGPLPRADLLVLGGDQVYPDATAHGYEDRFVGPFTAALPWTPPGRRPAVFAIPGNHDWHDGLTSFLRTFGQQKSIGGWQSYQSRSYWAVKLPHRWWLWGIDIHLDAYIDEPQLRFFDQLEVVHGDRIILCTAEPSWVRTVADPAAYRNLGYLERKVVTPKGARVAVTLTGDLHHYARYEDREGTQKITAGGGGAFLHPTHGLPPTTRLRVDPDDPGAATLYERKVTYPTPGRSRLLALGALGLPLRNLSFVCVPALLYLVLAADLVSAPSPGTALGHASPAEAVAAFFRTLLARPVSLALVALVGGVLVAFAKPPLRAWGRRPRLVAKTALGLGHTAMHVAAVSIVAASTLAPAPPGFAAAVAWLAVAGAFVFAVYLTVANMAFAAEGNHAFAAQRISGYRNFLRLHIGPDGSLDIDAIGVPRAWRRWTVDGAAAGRGDPWVVPAGAGPAPFLIERVTLAATSTTAGDQTDPSRV